jgi:hypothetical protein
VYFNPIRTQMALHSELEYRRSVIFTDSFLLGIVSDTSADVILTSLAPNIIWHLKSDVNILLVVPHSQNALSNFLCAVSERMLASEFVDGSHRRLPFCYGNKNTFRRIILVHCTSFCHFKSVGKRNVINADKLYTYYSSRSLIFLLTPL